MSFWGYRFVNEQTELAWRLSLGDIIRSRQAHAILCVLATGFISWALLSPDPFAVVPIRGLGWVRQLNDLFLHMGAFSALTVAIVSLSLRISGFLPLTIVMGLVAYAVATEILQTFVPGRTCDPADALANAAGIIVGIIAAYRLMHLLRQPVN